MKFNTLIKVWLLANLSNRD